MAVDEAILESHVSVEEAPSPTLRLYGWDPPALSLGRAQITADACDRDYLRRHAIDLVRRPTGGRAVLHEGERTYAVIGALDAAPFDGGVLEVYRKIADALEAGLRRLGVDARSTPVTRRAPSPRDSAAGPACFAAPTAHEIVVDGKKLVGSAQLRRRHAFLQHGSILLQSDARRLALAVGSDGASERFTDLGRARGRVVPPEELDTALVAAWESCFETRLERGELSAREALRAAQLRCWKYDSAAWTLDGRVGPRERRWGPPLSVT
jgi:lipoate-protein ligase A